MAFVKYHLPCPLCGGSDPVSVDEKGHGYCFSCNTHIKNYKEGEAPTDVTDFKTYQRNSMNSSEGSFVELTDRNISLNTAKKYGVKAVVNSSNVPIKHMYPYYIVNEIAGTKIRSNTKEFSWQGSPKGTGLFGQQLFQDGGKFVTIVEGECDAMAAYELLGSKWPVVSLKNGAAGAVQDVKDNLEFLEKFDAVVINFDSDKPGRDAARRVARVLRPGKARILTLPDDFKDANDVLKQGKHQTYVNSWWAAKIYTPTGVMNVSENKNKFHNRVKKESIPYPWDGLNTKLYGLRQGELVLLTGGTGLGKSSVTREIEHWLIKSTKDNVGVIALEEDYTRTVDGILSIEANARLYIDQEREKFSEEQLDTYFDNVYSGKNKDRVWIHAHFGSNDIEEIFSKLRYMIVGCNCKWIVVDHLHMLVSALAEGDERRTIDNIMTRFRSLVEETGAGLILVCHLRRVDGNKGHENGIETSVSHIRGSGSIAQLSDCILSLERNQQAEDKQEANTTRIRILKSRYTGDVGIASYLLYDRDTGRLSEIDADKDDEFEPLDNIPF
tara:strand:- start:1811 stop:3472 length:1662 start_codon:yes stop_codon:yes gene_type:complete